MADMYSNIRCMVITPEAQVVDAEALSVVLPAYDGLRGVFPGHAPLLCRLGTDLLSYRDTQNRSHTVFIDRGFGHVLDNEVTILTRSAFTASTITADDAREQLRQAEALPTATMEQVSDRCAAIQRAKKLATLIETQP